MSVMTLLIPLRWARLRQPWRMSLFLCLAASLPAQAPTAQPPSTSPDAAAATKSEPTPQHSDTTFTVDARLVNLPVVVRDKKGALIQNLTKDDFVLRVDDHPQNIRYFDQDRNLPLTLGLLVDTSGSVRNVLDEERTASSAFLDSMLTAPPGRDPDKAFVIQFASQVELLQDVTSSRPRLQAAIRDIDSSSPSFANNGGNNGNSQNDPNDPNDNGNNGGGNNGNNGNRGGRGNRTYRGGGTALYDAAFLAADEVMAKQKGRKAIIVLTDGVDNGSRENLTKAIESNQRADTIIYAIYFKGEEGGGYQPQRGGGGPGGRGGGIGFPGGGRYPGGGYPGGGGGGYPGGGGGGQRPQQNHTDGKKVLERMASETGGRMFEVSKKQDFDNIYKQIEEELRAQYRLGYTPDKDTASDGYHEIDLAMRDQNKQKNYNVQTRYGYYTGK
jgi:VWFA-related protein